MGPQSKTQGVAERFGRSDYAGNQSVTILGDPRLILGRAELLFPRRAEQTMVMPAIARRWTREEVLRLIEQHPDPTPRYELVDGVLLVSPAPSLAHQRAVSCMHGLLFEYLRAEPDVGEVLTSPSDTEPEPGVTVQPDVFVLPREEVRRIVKWPARVFLLAIEVLSPGDRSGDRTRKRALYQRSIPEYWIVNHFGRHIEVWRRSEAEPRIERERLEWQPPGASKPFVLNVPEYFARVQGETP